MNNMKVIDSWEKKEPKDVTSKERLSMEMALNNANVILESIKNLKENKDYLNYKRIVLEPSILTIQKRIDRNIKDLVDNKDLERQILQDQGMMIAFGKFSDFEDLERIFKVEVQRLTKQLNQVRNNE